MVLKVLWGQVCKSDPVERNAADTPLGDRMRRGLHHAGAASVFDHSRQQALQIRPFGGRMLGLFLFFAVVIDHGPGKSRLHARGSQDRPRQKGRGRLSIGAGHREHRHLFRRISVYHGGDLAHPGPDVADDYLRNGGGAPAFAQQRRSSRRYGLGRKFMRVAVVAFRRGKHYAGPRLAAVADHAAEFYRSGITSVGKERLVFYRIFRELRKQPA